MKYLIMIALVMLLVFPVHAQSPFSPFPNELTPNYFDGGLGMTWIDGNPYASISLRPEFTFGKFGLGLRIDLLFDTQNNFEFRTIGWEDASAIARSILYARYGYKGDPVYIKLGSLTAATIGHGFIMWQYSNEADFDKRRFGAVLDLDFDHVGIETGLSDIGNADLFGGRLYFRPLFSLDVPILSNLEFGGSAVTDLNPDHNKETNDGVTEWGLDVGLPIVKSQMFKTVLYFDYARFLDFSSQGVDYEGGEGKVAGINIGFPNISGIFSLDMRFERRWLGDRFLPSYFNTLYELERNLPNGLDKKSRLAAAKASDGYFGLLGGHIAGMFSLAGSFQKQDDIPYSGILHLEARLMDLVPDIHFIAYYDKTNIETFEDARTLDIFSQAVVEVGYVAYGFLMISMRYRWNFIEIEPGVFAPQERVEPVVSFVHKF
jgi:hypothetical protein